MNTFVSDHKSEAAGCCLNVMNGFLWCVALGFALKLLIVAEFDFPAFGGGHDDYWFVLRSLDWYWFAGTYDQMSHIKEPLWPLVMAVLRQTGVPLRLLLELGFGVTAFMVSILIVPANHTRAQFLRSLSFLLILLAPVSLPVFERTTSDAFFGMIFAVSIALFARACSLKDPKQIYWIASISAFLMGLLSVTRGEGTLNVVSGVGAFCGLVLCRSEVFGGWRRRCVTAAALLMFMFTAAFAVKLPFLVGNYVAFGNWSVSDQSEPSYERALKMLVSVRPELPVAHAPLSRATIEQIATHSPAMAEIAPLLLGGLGTGWSRASLGHPTPEGEIGAGWLGWAVRDAAAAAGKYATPAAARKFYQDVATEVEQAFTAGKLSKRRVLHPLAISLPSPRELCRSIADIVQAALLLRPFRPVPEWVDPRVQLHYDVATNRKGMFLEKSLGPDRKIESVSSVSTFVVKYFEVLQRLWLGVLAVVTLYAIFLLPQVVRSSSRSLLLPVVISCVIGFALIAGTRVGMMALIHGYAFHMTDWRYIFPVSLALCLLPLSIAGIAHSEKQA
jgi:hypothetical protein